MTDRYGKDTAPLQEKMLFLFDMDGTIYEDGVVFDGTLDMLKMIREKGGKYIFITNNSSKSVEEYVKKVNAMGIAADRSNFFTSSQATVLYLNEHFPGKKVYCVGTASFRQELLSEQIILCEPDEAEVLLVGFDTELTYEKLNNAARLLSTREIPYIATNPDLVCPVAYGFAPDCGSICNMLETATGKQPTYIGKPKPTMVELSMKANHRSKQETVVVGDRLYTDIASGVNAGVDTVCVLTGEATMEEIATYEADRRPAFTLDNIRVMYECCSGK